MKAEPIVHPVAETSAVPSPRTPERKRQDKRDPRLSVARLFSEEKARRLWESLPEEHRQDHFDSANMPEDYGRAFTKQTIDREKGWYSQAISFRGLPEPMIWELAWCVHQQVAEGYAITTVRFQELRRGLVLAIEHGGPQAHSARSLMALSHEEWAREVQRAVMRTAASRNARLGTHVLNSVKHLQDRLAHAYHDGDIIRLQQKWAREFIAAQGAPEGTDPRYLFLQTKNNRLGKRPYASATFHSRLGALTEKLTITDSVGRPVKISKTHTFRHTRATDLINAGVPIHVVMRYLGHVTPAMTMHYAKTLAVTAEREFLRYKKVTADGRTAEVNPSDLYDLLHLDQRADRVLPNGWCMLPPRQVCSKGNACLTCDKFVTDASHRDELQHQLGQTEVLIARRQTQFAARHGEPMGEDNVWLAGRLAETRALNKVLVALDQVSVREDGQLRAVRGAGAADRPESRSTARRQEPTT
ncbi:tyrosine-type recombinase/integrase [Streptomyces sp. CNZ748]|uniref:tyrosine-type recombinase/integrase n=1 Tax=Streptomyces sp. CNZ748 TaxID=2885160 RepID=UPI001E521731|nr:tyrosine-type recombinase/integrase [Streptomyces sp. CNZ748]